MSDTGVGRLSAATNEISTGRWYVVHSAPNSECKAAFHLKAQGFTAFLPQIEKTIRHARQLRAIRAALFPRYLFVRLNLDRDRWLSVRSTIGVSRLFTHSDGRPAPVPYGVVETLLEQTDGGLVRLDTGLKAGQRVRLLTGPFSDLVGTIARFDDAGRLRVLLELMGTEVPVSVHRSAVAPAA